MSTERSNSNTPLGGNNNNNKNNNTSQRHSILTPRQSEPSIKPISVIPRILPHERVFPIQIGTELFKLSGASLSSDAPSYFSQYFLCQIHKAEAAGQDPATATKTLYIDRDPSTFKDICLHLQGYHVRPRDGTHFVRLFADAQFYSLPRLASQLHDESIFMSIGHREFQIPREAFSDPGNSPNFFSLGFAIFFSDPSGDVFPGLERDQLIRPPSILPPSVSSRSADTFAELLHLLRGYPVDIRSEAHRQALLQDCRYFHLKGLEQRLVPHSISFNQVRRRDEIVLRLQDVLKSGVSVLPERVDVAAREGDNFAGWVNYARPFVDGHPAELVLEVGGECIRLHFNKDGGVGGSGVGGGGGGNGGCLTRLEFMKDGRTRVTKLFEVIASKLNLPPTTQPLGLLMASGGAASQPATPGNTPLSEDLVKCVLGADTAVTLDGRRYTGHLPSDTGDDNDNDDDEKPMQNGKVPAPSGADPGGGPPTNLTANLSLDPPSRKRRRMVDGGFVGVGGGGLPDRGYWLVRTGQWRLKIQGAKNGKGGVECVLVAVKIDALSGEHARNEARGFLSS
ncbi:hypothetical protein VPNG_05226 [Cytospora leucostoma]|uniref:Potassium channel tetramerisation-type BTB domain-containing protein n=1 Tax=Cytospora leucostoma TaxID=1230097 RepID=A0A423X7S9_9PEZI|nr:hypothetical protein VPNG_05226 [Cytospora leucostoma]